MTSHSDPAFPPGVSLLCIGILLLLNAFFVMAETSVYAVNKGRIKGLAQEGNRRAARLLPLLEAYVPFSASMRIAIVLSGFFASALASAALGPELFRRTFLRSLEGGGAVSALICVFLLSYAALVLSELYPRRLATQHAEGMALALAGPAAAAAFLLKPFHLLLTGTVKFLLKITRQPLVVQDEAFSEEYVKSMLEVGQETGVLNEKGKKMINRIFSFDDKAAYEVMTPRTDVFNIDINDPPSEYEDRLMEMKHTRIPVYDDDPDNVIGILNIKDYLIKAKENGFKRVDIREILRKPYFVPETKNLDTLFFDLQSSRQHIAILVDEYGGFSGIVTMEDLIEEIMGDIDDEYDEKEPDIEQLDRNTYRLSGFMDLDDLNEELGLLLESDSSETIGGFLMDILGEIPDENQAFHKVIRCGNCEFTIESVKDRRIESIRLFIEPREDDREDRQGEEAAAGEEEDHG